MVAVLVTGCVGGSSASTAASTVERRSDAELAQAWWTWAASEPDETNPVVDDSGIDCDRNQPSDVWFLAGTFGGRAARTCSVPVGRELFFPVLNSICGVRGDCATWFDDAERSATVDGVAVEVREIDIGPVEIRTKEGNSITHSGGVVSAIVAGWWVRIPPLSLGRHSVEIHGRSREGFEVFVTYELDIVDTSFP